MSNDTAVIENPPVVAAESTPTSAETRKVPNPKCKKCYGRGHVGQDVIRGGPIPCRCTYSEKEEAAYKQRLREEERQRSLARK